MNEPEFERCCETHFSFLKDFGFVKEQRNRNPDKPVFRVSFVNSCARIVVEGIHYSADIAISLGKAEPLPEEQLKYSFEYFLDLCEPENTGAAKRHSSMPKGQEQQIRYFAEKLLLAGKDILKCRFDDWDKIDLAYAKRFIKSQSWYENSPNRLPDSELPPAAKASLDKSRLQVSRYLSLYGDLLLDE